MSQNPISAPPRDHDLGHTDSGTFVLGRDKKWHYRRSLASRVALLTAAAVALALLLMTVVTFMTVRFQLQRSLDQSLIERATKAARATELAQMTSQEVPLVMLDAADVRIAYLSSDGSLSKAAAPGPELDYGRAELEVAQGDRASSLRTVPASNKARYRVAAVPAGAGNALILAQPLTTQDQTLTKLSLVMLAFGGFGVITAALAGWGVATNGLRPVRRLTARAEEIAQTEDLTPLEIEGDDEIARLASSFNHMLTALSASRDRQRQLIGDAGHELRTPLTSLRTNVDLLSQAGDKLDSAQRTEVLDDVRAQTEELSTLVGDLVELARDEPVAHTVEELEFADLVERALSRVRRRAPGVTFDSVLQPWTVYGEAGSLERAVTNLLDNAAKWSPPHGTVTVRLADGVLTVVDQGPGISAEDLPLVFERFYRSKESRTMPGSGLGLSIVKQVAERHSGAVRADNAVGAGARLAFWLPAAEKE